MHNPEFAIENETHKILLDFEVRTDHLILGRRPELVLIKKKNRISCLVDFTIDYRVKIKENEKIENYLDFARKLKKL